MKKKQIAVWVLSLLPILAVAAFYSKLPAKVPTNWGFNGEVTYSDKSQLWILGGMAPFFAVMFQVLPKIDPKKRSYNKFEGSYLTFQLFMMLFLSVIMGITILESLRPGTINVGIAVSMLVGMLFIVIGNMMPRFRPNFFCGIRTPWTLSSETVWVRTHRLGGRMMFVGGVLILGSCFLPEMTRFWWMLVLVFLIVLIPGVMSFVWFRSEQQ